jgi:lysine 2,3-aminomutase
MSLELLSSPAAPPEVTVEPRTFEHRDLRRDDYWRRLPAFAEVDAATFHHHTFQARHTVTNVRQLQETLRDLAPESFYADVVAGLRRAPMALRISPHLLGLIDWADPYHDPIRTQFMPVASQQVSDHPELRLDSLHEQKDSPVPGLTHRYPDKALFLPLDSCPVYCRFCTRSYAVGGDTDIVEKLKFNGRSQRWEDAFNYIASRPELEDIVISGGDTYNLKAEHLQEIGERLLNLPNIRRIRYATKGLAVLPQKILTDHAAGRRAPRPQPDQRLRQMPAAPLRMRPEQGANLRQLRRANPSATNLQRFVHATSLTKTNFGRQLF